MALLNQVKRQQLAIFVDACIVVNAYTLASLTLFARWAPLEYYRELLYFLPVAVIVHSLVNLRFGLYRSIGRYAGVDQALKIVKAALFSVFILLTAGLLIMHSAVLHVLVVVPVGGIIVFVLTAGVRFYPRVFYERSLREVGSKIRLLIAGAGEAGEMIIRSIQKERRGAIDVVAFIDDDAGLEEMEIHGVPIYTPTSRIGELARKKSADEILIAIPSADLETFQRIWKLSHKTGLPVKTLRPLQSTQLGKVGLDDIREVRIEDVLGRQPVKTDYSQINGFIQEKRVLITGAGGSIGSELALQISQHNPAGLILVDHDESALYHLHEQLSRIYFQKYELIVADVKDKNKLTSIFSEYHPSLVFHAAAYKHVPLMELHPDSAVHNNVKGTHNTAQLSGAFGAECFVNISTDKAVAPVNVMGATKSLSERLVEELSALYPQTKYCSVRFGNVLGSRGSVIPIFREQIRKGGPITITHPEMSRYFMLISEAVDLVLQAAAFPDGNVIYVLEMGKPVRIVDLAQQMISLMSPPREPDIIFSGLRPGEKVHEELLEDEERRDETVHPMIFSASRSQNGLPVLPALPRLFEQARHQDKTGITRTLRKLITSYSPFDMRLAGTVESSGRNHDSGISCRPFEQIDPMTYSWQPEESGLQKDAD